MQKALVIGSKGFIGSSLVNYLSSKNLQVYEADIINDYQAGDNYFLIDVANSSYHSIFEHQNFDICINCSGAASVPNSIKNPLRDYNLNTVNVFKILDAIKTYNANCKFINLSSAAVYGNPTSLPIKADTELRPVSPYGIHKQMSEQICYEYFKFFNIKTCSLRIFSAFGEGLKKQLFWDLYQKTKAEKDIVLFGTGSESRDFIYIQDLLQAIYLVAENAKFEGEALNIANGKEVYIKDCVEIFYSFFDKEINYKFSGEGRKGDPNNWVADIKTLKSLGYKQNYDLKEGLYNFFKWVKLTERE